MTQVSKNVAVSKAVNATAQNDNAGSNEKKVIKAGEFVTMSVEEFKEKYKFYENNRGNGTDEERADEIAQEIAYGNTSWLLDAVKVDRKTGKVIDRNTSGMARVLAHDRYGADVVMDVQLVDLPTGLKFHTAVQKSNNCRVNWNLDMYVTNQIAEKNGNYIRLKDMLDELGSPFIKVNTKGKKKYEWSYGACLCGSEQKPQLREGTYVLESDARKKQTVFGREVAEIWNKAGQPAQGSWMEPFIVALSRIKDDFGRNYNLERILSNVKREDFDYSQSQKVWRERISGWLTNQT